MRSIHKLIKNTAIFYLLLAGVYWAFVRPAYMQWGATPAEIKMILPGDELISSNRIISTRAISINATKDKIWPWFAQTGQNRGGFNSYYWLENLFGAKMVNAQKINSDWQNPMPGDTVYYGRDQGYALVALVKKNEYYSLGGWTFYLDSIDTGSTRLIVRYPSMEVRQSKLAAIYYYGLFEPLHFIMETGMMMGIKVKTEKR